MNTTDTTKPVMGVIIGTDEPHVAESVQLMMASSFGGERNVRCTVKASVQQVRRAVSLYDFDVVFLFTDTMKPDGGGDRFEQMIELIGELRKTTRATVIVATSYYPAGFLTQAEQAGVDGLIDVPFTAALMKETIENAIEGRQLKFEAEDKAAALRLKRAGRRPRVVILDDCAVLQEMIAGAVRSVWSKATIVSCIDSHAAWEELQRTPPDLFVTDLVHGGLDGCEILRRLAEAEVKYPIAVVSGNLPEREAEVRAAAGPGLQIRYWPKPFGQDEFAEGIEELLDD